MMVTATQTDQLDRELLNLVQSDFPLTEQPYAEIARALHTSEADVMDRIGRLKKRNVIRQIGAIFDTRRLGYQSCLVAFRYAPERLHKAAQRINQHPGVSHNYARNGAFNLWFTIAVPPHDHLEATVASMAEETQAEAYRIMPTIRFFKIGVNFDMVKNEGAAYDYYSPDGYTKGAENGVKLDTNWNKAQPITEFEIGVIRELQEDLPVTERPFDAMADRLGLTVPELFDYAAQFQARGIMRRFSAVLYHRKAGFQANAMVVWKVPEERAEEVGVTMAQSRWVTHCYQRPTFPDWPFTHFTMIHATTPEQCERVAEEIAEATQIAEYQLLYSSREYKKTRVRYFVEDEYKKA